MHLSLGVWATSTAAPRKRINLNFLVTLTNSITCMCGWPGSSGESAAAIDLMPAFLQGQ